MACKNIICEGKNCCKKDDCKLYIQNWNDGADVVDYSSPMYFNECPCGDDSYYYPMYVENDNEKFDKLFVDIIKSVKRHLNIVSKLEEALYCELPSLCENAYLMVEKLENMSGVQWTDDIYDLVYSDKEEDTEKVLSIINKMRSGENIDLHCLFKKRLLYILMNEYGYDVFDSRNIINSFTTEDIDNCIVNLISPEDAIKEFIEKSRG